MPYIVENRRKYFDEAIQRLGLEINSEGELNYVITELLQYFITDAPNYSAFNTAVGVLECVKLEMYRRMIAPYEDKKKEQNGDVYPSETA